MNPINRVGQKVLCIGDDRVWKILVCPSLKVFPKKGEVYTVASFADTVAGLPGIHLREIGGLECECANVSGDPWLIKAFKPLDERRTDIGELRAILDRAPEQVPA